jgi:lysine 2,3-aminomutase
MTAALRVKGATTWVALHANHARELTGKARTACAAIVDAGIPMVSQSVLLRGVNDNAAALEALMRAFVECRIKPYYLHHGDLAPGTAHLRTTLEHGQQLMRSLRGRVSGLCQPDYVLDIPGGHGKSPVGPNYLSLANYLAPEDSFPGEREPQGETRYRVADYCGDVHLYPPKP